MKAWDTGHPARSTPVNYLTLNSCRLFHDCTLSKLIICLDNGETHTDSAVWANDKGLKAQIAYLEKKINALTSKVMDLQVQLKKQQDILEFISVDYNQINNLKGPHLIVTGANLHVRSGSGSTKGAVNGVGNFIIGYNEKGSNEDLCTGSHNIVMGLGHYFTTYGSFISGIAHTVYGPDSTLLGGDWNFSFAQGSALIGGSANRANGDNSVIIGGIRNETNTSADGAAVVGGNFNVTGGPKSTITGGYGNRANGTNSSVSGGLNNITNDENGWKAGTYYWP